MITSGHDDAGLVAKRFAEEARDAAEHSSSAMAAQVALAFAAIDIGDQLRYIRATLAEIHETQIRQSSSSAPSTPERRGSRA